MMTTSRRITKNRKNQKRSKLNHNLRLYSLQSQLQLKGRQNLETNLPRFDKSVLHLKLKFQFKPQKHLLL